MKSFFPFFKAVAVASSFLCGSQQIFAATGKITTFPASTDTPAKITLLPKTVEVGRDNPFYDRYMPQVVFSGRKAAVSCVINIPKPKDKIEPGETADVALRCLEKFYVIEGKKSFTAFEGGRKIGEGELK